MSADRRPNVRNKSGRLELDADPAWSHHLCLCVPLKVFWILLLYTGCRTVDPIRPHNPVYAVPRTLRLFGSR